MQAFLWLIAFQAPLLSGAENASIPREPIAVAGAQRSPPSAGIVRGPCGPNGCLNPVEVVTYASYVAPKGRIAGIVEVQVRTAAVLNGRLYLNSELDYRDRNNLSIVLPLAEVAQWAPSLSEDEIKKRFTGKRIFAQGAAQRVRIDFLDESGKPSGKYYYQVHMYLPNRNQLRLEN